MQTSTNNIQSKSDIFEFKITFIKIVYFFILCLFIGIFIPPTLMHLGFTQIAKYIYFFYGFLCHQLPERSFWLFGNKFAYKLIELTEHGYTQALILDPSKRFIGNEFLGYKLAVCARDTGLYLGLLIGGLIPQIVKDPLIQFNLKQKNNIIYFTKWKLVLFLALILPLVIDGTTQLIASLMNFDNPFYQSNYEKRLLTGILFGLALGFWAFATLKINE